MENEDTETLLALVASLVNQEHAHSAMLDVLLQCDGDVPRAVQILNAGTAGPQAQPAGQGRGKKKGTNLDAWLRGSSSSTVTTKAGENSQSYLSAKRARSSSPDVPQHTGKKPRSMQEPTIKSPSKTAAITNEQFMAMLRPPNSTDGMKSNLLKHPPLTLATPEQVAKHTPCTLHSSVLPPELACRLFYTMIDLSVTWQRNKWWLFDRVVESPHRTSFYVRASSSGTPGDNTDDMAEAAQYWYNGRQTEAPDPFPPAMEEACEYIEKIVNSEMRKRARFSLEWGGEPASTHGGNIDSGNEPIIWRANVAASNRYEGSQESVGFHSDQLTYLGPYPTIASLSLGTTRTFRLREVIPTDEKETRSARTYNIPLAHNTLVIMHASCQEIYKHSIPPQRVIDPFRPSFPHPSAQDDSEIPPSNARINITFRFYRPDYHSSTTPRCKCGVPCILRPDMKNRYSLPSKSGSSGEQDESNGRAKDSKSDKKAEKRELVAKYWWTCYAGAQNEGKGCGFWKVMDAVTEGRGPFAGDVAPS